MGLFRRKQVSRFYLLRNEDLVVYVNNLGAELMSVKDAKNKTEYIWNGDPEYWGRRSPILFPFVGALNGQLYRHKGREYLMPRHGFARDMIFSKSAETEDQIWFVLDSDEKTKKKDFSQMETIYGQLEERMKSIIGTKVAIRSRNYKKGKIEIEYYSNDELERIIDLIESVKQVG